MVKNVILLTLTYFEFITRFLELVNVSTGFFAHFPSVERFFFGNRFQTWFIMLIFLR